MAKVGNPVPTQARAITRAQSRAQAQEQVEDIVADVRDKEMPKTPSSVTPTGSSLVPVVLMHP